MASNFVPVIPSTALPQTPASDWAESTNDVLGAHVTRTPLGTPGPSAPGAFPDALAEEASYADAAKEQTLLATARQYFPAQEDVAGALESAKTYLPGQDDVARALESAKAYLPAGVAAYLRACAAWVFKLQDLTSHLS